MKPSIEREEVCSTCCNVYLCLMFSRWRCLDLASECCLPDWHTLSESNKMTGQKLVVSRDYTLLVFMYYPKNDFIIHFPAPFASDTNDLSQKDEITRGRDGHYGMVQCSRVNSIVLMETTWIDVRCNIRRRGFPYNLWVWGYWNKDKFVWGTQMHSSANLLQI